MLRTPKAIAVTIALALVAGAFIAGPAQAKKKKKKKPPAPPVCAPYVPGELGSGAEIAIVTDEATAEAPVTVELDTGPGLGFSSTDPGGDEGATSHVYYNVQVDSANPEAGLYVMSEFAPPEEYDLFLRLADGSTVAYTAGANQSPVGWPVDPLGLAGEGNGGRSEFGSDILEGIRSADCAGYTVDVASAITPGGPVTLSLWLGESLYP